ncbi:MAG TPA: 1-(5-phosphoribosyl)-5-[(5-phosphoribosylamino)methylideneamino] imidazole-4-carboxamide isomerase [Candidatus Eisenbacteria bacterium]|nr:1-(5-phosphoribosyl)-5-[(5-phosphoribosylamino)methylideneamino] imidazole-4-carboxamide isomerase [Candidatus Eisenbacteria bacterium]
MLIPSIDLMGGKIVQLVQGSRKALEFDNFEEWINRFASYPLVQLIDLDAAKRVGNNRKIVREIAQQLPCQVGGGIRSVETARAMLDLGARRVILGSSLISNGTINASFAHEIAEALGAESLVFAVDSLSGRVAIKGWQETTNLTPIDMMSVLESHCSAFLYTHIDTEGMLKGIPMDVIQKLRAVTTRRLIAAGGIRSSEEVDALDAMGVDAVVGMAIYQNLIAV